MLCCDKPKLLNMNNEKVIIVEALMIIVLAASTAVLCVVVYLRGLKIKSLEDNVSSKANEIGQLNNERKTMLAFLRLDMGNIRHIENHLNDDDFNNPSNLSTIYGFKGLEKESAVSFLTKQYNLLFVKNFNELPQTPNAFLGLISLHTKWLYESYVPKTFMDHLKTKSLIIIHAMIESCDGYDQLETVNEQILDWMSSISESSECQNFLTARASSISEEDLRNLCDAINSILSQNSFSISDFHSLENYVDNAVQFFSRALLAADKADLLKASFKPIFEQVIERLRNNATVSERMEVVTVIMKQFEEVYVLE